MEGGARAAIKARDFTVAEEKDRALLLREEDEEEEEMGLGIWGSLMDLGRLTRVG